MKVFDAINRRRSIRVYTGKPVPDNKLRRVLEAGRLAPSARNIQEWIFVVVRDKDLKKRLSVAANNQEFIATADSVIVGCATTTDYVMRCGQTAYPIDVSIALTQMTIQAVEEGLGTCWIGSFDAAMAAEIVGVPPGWVVAQLLPLGYPAGDYTGEKKTKQRKSLEEIASWESWGQLSPPRHR